MLLMSCATQLVQPTAAEKSKLTHGQVQLTLRKAETSMDQVLVTFGAPNIMTTDAQGREVWTYQRHASISQSSHSDNYATVLFFGNSESASGFEQSSRTMTLIIKFRNGIVNDFQSRYTSF